MDFYIQDLSKEKLKAIDELYICPLFGCNLKCPHCTLRNITTKMDLNKILETIDYINQYNTNIVYDLFGGEPLLLSDSTLDLIYERIKSHTYHISTNLLAYNPSSKIQDKILRNAEYIDTSWNPLRFTEEQYKLWIKNVRRLQSLNIKLEFMITLTDDLITNYSPEEFYQLILFWKPYGLTLDFLIGKETNIEKINDWLVDLYRIWNCETIFGIAERIKNTIKYNTIYRDCSNNYTLLPDGKIKQYCPYHEKTEKNLDCIYCSYYNICRGVCPIQSQCTFPKKLYEYIRKEII